MSKEPNLADLFMSVEVKKDKQDEKTLDYFDDDFTLVTKIKSLLISSGVKTFNLESEAGIAPLFLKDSCGLLVLDCVLDVKLVSKCSDTKLYIRFKTTDGYCHEVIFIVDKIDYVTMYDLHFEI